MNTFPANIEFKYPWRKYQSRVLSELEEHIHDNHLHIVAPPGSGKTVLGLQVALQLNKPTLVFAPTIAIRNQWIQRFCELFLQTRPVPEWISRDIRRPAFFTVVTYQSLHAACTNREADEEEEGSEEENDEGNANGDAASRAEEVIAVLKAQNIGTIVVDEAHHLKNAWWKSLTEVKKALDPTVVGLTATPPYDVSPQEWQRYLELNGPVDAEISVPELVLEGDLCPHQDYVFFSGPTGEECQKIANYRRRIQSLFHEIKSDTTLIQALEQHPIFSLPHQHLDWIYSNLEYYSATLIFLNAAGKKITEDHLEVIGDKQLAVPDLNYEWIEILLNFYLYSDPGNFTQYQKHQEKLINKLKRGGVLERRSIDFRHNPKINRFLSSSISKLKSMDRIVDFEHDHLQENLRMVILTDYIRKEFLVNAPQNDLVLNKIGVLPIFEQLRRTNERRIKIGVLTGSLVIIPRTALPVFITVAAGYGIENVSTIPLAYDDQYLVIGSSAHLKHEIVHIVTQVFQQGGIEVLIGTKSLLGEGWDAPAINALILASFVGSYVLSNQMRGRAIRTEKANRDKTSNIWHLVCLDPTDKDGGDDIQLLKRRFKAFVGVSFREELSIENGLARLDLAEPLTSPQALSQANQNMFSAAGRRSLLKDKWQRALEGGKILIEEVKVPFPKDRDYKQVRSLYHKQTIAYLFGVLASGMATFSEMVLEGLRRSGQYMTNLDDLTRWLTYIGLLALAIFGRQLFRVFRLSVKYRDISLDMQRIGEALLESLIKVGSIHTDRSALKVIANMDQYGAIYCHLKGGTTYEKSTFIKSLQEIVESVDRPRYIIIRKSFFLKILSQRDYHAVPELLGRKKSSATYFKHRWKQYVGACELVYTRNIEGRKILLKSRIHALASAFREKTERINQWR